MSRSTSIEGLRGILHLSMVALHITMLVTVHLPDKGVIWERFRGSLMYTIFQGGGTQVDIFLMLSGFLTVRRLLRAPKDNTTGVLHYELLSRLLRFWPVHTVALVWNNLIMGDIYSLPEFQFKSFIYSLFFVMNYVGTYLPLCMAPAWSSCCDIQFGIVLVATIDAIRRSVNKLDSDYVWRVMKVLFCYLLVSWIIRALLFHPVYGNLLKMGELFHMGKLIGDVELESFDWLGNVSIDRIGVGWITDNYNHTWHTDHQGSEIAQGYSKDMYLVTHARFGPMVVGGIAACIEYLMTQKTSSKTYGIKGKLFKYVIVAWAILVLVGPCVAPQPPLEMIPHIGQFALTVFQRSQASIAAAVLVVATVVPRNHPYAIPLICDILSLAPFRYIGSLSYCSFLVHFRVILEMALKYYRPESAFILEEGGDVDQVMNRLFSYMLQLYAVSLCASLAFAFLLHQLVELPCLGIRNTILQRLKKRASAITVNANGVVTKEKKGKAASKEMDQEQVEHELSVVLEDLRAAEELSFTQAIEIQRLQAQLESKKDR